MFDWDDANNVTDDAIIFGPGGWFGVIFIVIVAVIAYTVADSNEKDCSKITCPNGQVSRLLDHQCLCAEPAPRQP
jgi:hypothetical protein